MFNSNSIQLTQSSKDAIFYIDKKGKLKFKKGAKSKMEALSKINPK